MEALLRIQVDFISCQPFRVYLLLIGDRMHEGMYSILFKVCLELIYLYNSVAVGITHYTQKAHFVRAMLEGIAFQTTEILEAMEMDSSLKIVQLKVDGGLTNSKLLMQIQSDLLGKKVGMCYDRLFLVKFLFP